MVGRKKKTRRNKPLAGNHQRSWIWGRHAVLESLRGARWTPLEIRYCPSHLDEEVRQEIEVFCRRENVPLVESDIQALTSTSKASDHQGLIALMPEFPYSDFAEIAERGQPSLKFVLLLDRIQDPFNFGSILRSAELFGVDAVIIPERDQVGVTTHVARSSAGAVNYLPICRVSSLSDACRRLNERGLTIIASTAEGSVPPAQIDLTQPCGIVIGNEGTGIDPAILSFAESRCAIPQSGRLDSLNAAVAAGILCYEVLRQRISSRQ